MVSYLLLHLRESFLSFSALKFHWLERRLLFVLQELLKLTNWAFPSLLVMAVRKLRPAHRSVAHIIVALLKSRPSASITRCLLALLCITTICLILYKWIHEDLAPWRRSRISPETLEEAKQFAAFRVIIVGGRLYTEFYYACVQTRAMFTLWGILQLLERYPGMVPDVDLMFDCMDKPAIKKRQYRNKWPPPPLFRYCGNKDAFDIPFPDWSFWGWAETHLLPWDEEFNTILKGSKQVKWERRHQTAYWKGNPYVGSPLREELLKCNSSGKYDWGAQIFHQDWNAEASKGYQDSKLGNQCKHRLKIYAEGHAWSVSFKYILSCDSPVLVPSLTYYDFFTRGLIPQIHYWPVTRNRLCSSIKYAVNWANEHTSQAQAIGRAGQRFVQTNLTMEFVYDYMFHLLNEYAKLQKFQPRVTPEAQELCRSSILCFADAKQNFFLKRSSVQASEKSPCSLPSPDHKFIMNLREMQWNKTKEVEHWEDASRKKRSKLTALLS
eukprot:c21039_g1_i2 orf=324-1808(+)